MDASSIIINPSLALRTPTPIYPLSPESPGPGRDMDDLKPVNLPAAISTLAIAPETLGTTPPSPPHQPVLRIRLAPAKPVYNVEEDQAALEHLVVHAKARIRPIACGWREEGEHGDHFCDAVLGSYNLFRKHLKRHVEKLNALASASSSKAGPSMEMQRCGWPACHFSIPTRDQRHAFLMHRHVKKVHLETMQKSCCPFRQCRSPDLGLPDDGLYDHCLAHPAEHPRPWSLERLRPYPRPHKSQPSTASLPPLPLSIAQSELHALCHATPWRGEPPARHRKTRSRRADSSEDGTMRPLAVVRDIIVPSRDDELCVEMPSGLNVDTAISSSIYPHVLAHSDISALSDHRSSFTVQLKSGKSIDLATILRASENELGPSASPTSSPAMCPLLGIQPPSSVVSTSTQNPTSSSRSHPKMTLVPHNLQFYRRFSSPRGLVGQAPLASNDDRGKRQRRGPPCPQADVPVPDSKPLPASSSKASIDATGPPLVSVVRAAHVHARKKAKKTYGLEYQIHRQNFLRRGKELGDCDTGQD